MPVRVSPNKALGLVVILGVGTMLIVALRVAQGSAGGIAASNGPLRAEAISEIAMLSQQPAEAAFNDFCETPDAMADDEDALSRCLGGGTFDLVNRWPVKRLDSLADKAPCSWAMYGEKRFSVPAAPLCLPDPAADAAVSKPIHEWGWYGGVDEHHFALGTGYAAGTPLKASHAKLLRQAAAATAAAGSRFTDLAQAVSAARLPAVKDSDALGSWCSRERPVVVDVGAGLGLHGALAAGSGCTVLMFEPLLQTAGRLWQTLDKNGWTDHVYLYKNAVGKQRKIVSLQPPSVAGAPTPAAPESVSSVVLSELFDGSATRPRHPFLGRPVEPGDVAIIKVELEGLAAAALWSLRRVIELGLPPLLKVKFVPSDMKRAAECDPVSFVKWLYGLGYEAYSFEAQPPRVLTLSDFEAVLIPALGRWDAKAKAAVEEAKAQGLPPSLRELLLVHDSAPVPLKLGVVGAGGQGPV